MENRDLKVGDRVISSGYEGTVISVYIAPTRKDVGMYEVRLESGEICVPGDELIKVGRNETN